MNVRMLMSAIAIASFGSVASAATVTQLIHFDDASAGDKDYTTSDGNFLFDPTNFQSSALCADTTATTGPTHGRCLIEGKQGVLPEMTRLTSDATGAKTFSLDSFYFLLTGNGTGSSNSISATTAGGTSTFEHSGIYTNVYDYLTGNLVTTALVDGVGYIADVSGLSYFDDVTSVQFGAASTAQVRLDCVVASFDGTTDSPLNPDTACGLDGGGGVILNPVPIPAGGILLVTALGAAGMFGRRKARKS